MTRDAAHDDALDALPPGIKAWLCMQRGKIDGLEKRVAELEQREAARAAVTQ